MSEYLARGQGRPRFGFRTQLALLIALTISLSGAVVLGALYIAVANEFHVVIEATPAPAGLPGDVGASSPGPAASPGGSGTPPEAIGEGDSVVVNGTRIDALTDLRSQVLDQTFPWLGAILVALTVTSTMLGWWLSGRLLRRVTEITHTARAVADGDLSARLALPGPRDEITELGDTFDTMLERLEGAMVAQQRFVANASHELRTPLTSGQLALEAPLLQGLLHDEGQVAARRALGSIQRASSILSALLTLSAATDSPDNRTERVDLAALARAATDLDAELADHRGHRVICAYDAAPVVGDPVLLEQAVANLVHNAILHAPEGSALDLRTGVTGGRAHLRTSNPGEVHDPAGAAQLSEPFHRGHGSRVTGPAGSGLGLAIVRAVAERFAGRLDVSPRRGGGLEVEMSFPVDQPHSDVVA